jgi:hypothetical protein
MVRRDGEIASDTDNDQRRRAGRGDATIQFSG